MLELRVKLTVQSGRRIWCLWKYAKADLDPYSRFPFDWQRKTPWRACCNLTPIFFVALSHTGSGRSWTEPSDTPTIRIYSAPHPWYIIYWWSFTGTGASITLSIRTTASAVRTGYSATRRRRTWWRNICRATTGARWPSPPSVTCPGNSIFLRPFHRTVFPSALLTARESRALLESRML